MWMRWMAWGKGFLNQHCHWKNPFLCMSAVSVMSSGSWNLAGKSWTGLFAIQYFSCLLWFSGLMYLGHAHVKISYWSYFFFACIPTSEDLLDTKQALFKPFPCSSTGMLQSVLLKREKINHSCFVFFILNAWFWQWKQFVCLNCAADTFLLLFESYPPYFIQLKGLNSLKGQS